VRALAAFELLEKFDFWSVLDVGSGAGHHARMFREAGKHVTTISCIEPADIVGDYLAVQFPFRYDVLWLSHVLEHQVNPGAFLAKVRIDLKEGGILAVTVPPMKPQIVGGHVTLWNAGLLLYHLVLAGFDCSEAKVRTEGYDVSVVVRYQPAEIPGDLVHDAGDLERLAHLFPMPVSQGFNGEIQALNWHPY
jgi:SAM-dependent methyltransferase